MTDEKPDPAKGMSLEELSDLEQLVREERLSKRVKPPIKSGWRGNINGGVEKTQNTSVNVEVICLSLDRETAHSLCNVLHDSALSDSRLHLEGPQLERLSNLGAALGALIDHPAANNGGRAVRK